MTPETTSNDPELEAVQLGSQAEHLTFGHEGGLHHADKATGIAVEGKEGDVAAAVGSQRFKTAVYQSMRDGEMLLDLGRDSAASDDSLQPILAESRKAHLQSGMKTTLTGVDAARAVELNKRGDVISSGVRVVSEHDTGREFDKKKSEREAGPPRSSDEFSAN